ncbi:MAG: ABC transporter permease [Candidatus Bipolaricaulia bacterium]
MLSYLVRRFFSLIVTLWLVSVLTFLVLQIVPGDPAQVVLGLQANPETLARLREQMGLNQPPLVRYFNWIRSVVTGDFGSSFHYHVPVGELILTKLAVSGPLAALALLLTLLIALPLGIYAASHHGRLGDYGIMLFSQLGLAVPTFWAGILLIILFAVNLKWFPSGGFAGWAEDPLLSLRSLFLPALSLSLVQSAIITRMTRSAMLEVLNEDYVTTARSKGLAERVVIYKHALKNAFISVATVIGLQAGQLLAGAIIIEAVFHLPGMGGLVVLSIGQRDLPVIQGIVPVIAAVIVIVNFLVDLLYGYLDPRIRYD